MSKKVKAKVEKNKLVYMPSPVDSSVSVYVSQEFADDEIIEREMMGDVLPHFIYQYTQDGKTVTGLSVKGVSEVVRRLNINKSSGSKIHINPKYLIKEEVEREGEKGIEVSVFAEDLVTGNSGWGIKFEPYMKTGRNGQYKNTFAVEKALSKAERNAKRKLIPEVMATKMIQKMIASDPSSVKVIEAPKTQTVAVKPTVPKPSTPEELATVIINGISKLKTVGEVVTWNEKAQSDKRFSKVLKDKINASALSRADELDNKLDKNGK